MRSPSHLRPRRSPEKFRSFSYLSPARLPTESYPGTRAHSLDCGNSSPGPLSGTSDGWQWFQTPMFPLPSAGSAASAGLARTGDTSLRWFARLWANSSEHIVRFLAQCCSLATPVNLGKTLQHLSKGWAARLGGLGGWGAVRYLVEDVKDSPSSLSGDQRRPLRNWRATSMSTR